MPIFFIGTFIALIKLVFGTNFLPDISFCASYPNIFCKLPIIRLPLGMLSLKFAVFMLVWASIVFPAYFIFVRLGFKESKREYKETKADKKARKKDGFTMSIKTLNPETGKDESRNNAKQDVNGRWVSEPLTYYGDHLEHVLADELHGNKAKGITAIKNSGYDNDNKSEE